jgi:hypothetical protein
MTDTPPHISLTSMDTVLLWRALRLLADRTQDKVARRESLSLIRKLGGTLTPEELKEV